jgi:hypothetical protein
MTQTSGTTATQAVTFHLFPRLRYPTRMTVGLGLIAAGMLLQAAMTAWFPGLLLLIAGNIFLLVKGYSNLISGEFDANAQWTRTTAEKIAEITAMNRKIKKWDRSLLDFSNPLGGVLGFFILAPSLFGFMIGTVARLPTVAILTADILVLLSPHWFSGMRRILTLPELDIKLRCVNTLLKDTAVVKAIDPAAVEYFLLLKTRKGEQIPGDIKFKLPLANQHPDFLGFFGQVVTNTVSSTCYPYFYCVLVAKAGYGLPATIAADPTTRTIIAEKNVKDDVEVLVIRQKTSRTAGYSTDAKAARAIFLKALETARQCAGKN